MKISVADTANAAKLHPDRQAVLLNLAGLKANRVDVTLAAGELFTSRTYQVGDEPVVQSVDRLKKGDSAYLLLRPYDQYGNLITDVDWLNANLKAEETVGGRQSAKALAQGPGGATAIRVTAGSHATSTSITVTVRSLSGEVLAQASITVESDPAFYVPPAPAPAPAPKATIAVDPDSIVTVEKDSGTGWFRWCSGRGDKQRHEGLERHFRSDSGGWQARRCLPCLRRA
ncbi:MAG: hypothetical protein C6W59_12710 [Paenibacillaceae bacterium]|nr:MAG: hypothetical protein C6W59_12710 [Paenibacillaceae bacterium]